MMSNYYKSLTVRISVASLLTCGFIVLNNQPEPRDKADHGIPEPGPVLLYISVLHSVILFLYTLYPGLYLLFPISPVSCIYPGFLYPFFVSFVLI